MIPDRTTLDLETSVRNTGENSIGDFAASPFHPDNRIVSAGFLSTSCSSYYDWYYTGEGSLDNLIPTDLLVGQNIKFDLLYLLKEIPDFRVWLVKSCTIWDIQLAEYLLTGQESQYANLNAMSEKYGGTQKSDPIKEYWDNGTATEDIPKEELMEYMKYDVLNTDLVFVAQYKQAQELGMLPLIESQMEALLCTTECEFNGMCFDKELAHEYIKPLQAEMEPIKEYILGVLKKVLPHYGTTVDPYSAGSGDQISLVLFGGNYKGREKKDMMTLDDDFKDVPILIKSGPNKGNVRRKYYEYLGEVKGMIEPDKKWALKKDGFYQVDDKVLKTIGNKAQSAEMVTFLQSIRRFRDLNKELSTYLIGYSKIAWPQDGKHYLHGKYNHTATDTGRLSSSQPNLQNVSGKE